MSILLDIGDLNKPINILYPKIFKSSFNDKIMFTEELYIRYKKLEKLILKITLAARIYFNNIDITLKITSGARTKKTHFEITGSNKKSQHKEFEAFDFELYLNNGNEVSSHNYKMFGKFLLENKEELKILQLIVYTKEKDNKSFIHIGLKTERALKDGIKYYVRGLE